MTRATAEGRRALLRHIGRKIRFLRTHRYGGALTQAQVARAAGLSVSFLSMLERGERSPSVETLHEVARALGAPLSELFHFEDEVTAIDPSFSKLVLLARDKGLGAGELEQLLAVAKAMFDGGPPKG